jgi:hypothetical protein
MKGTILLFLFLALLWTPAHANFYQGKTVTIISGTTAGAYLQAPYARVIAQHLGKHVPGVRLHRQKHAGGPILLPTLSRVAKPDSDHRIDQPGLYYNQLAGRKRKSIRLGQKFHGSGSPDWSDHVLYMRTDTPTRRFTWRLASTPSKCTVRQPVPRSLSPSFGRNHRDKFDIIWVIRRAEMDPQPWAQ